MAHRPVKRRRSLARALVALAAFGLYRFKHALAALWQRLLFSSPPTEARSIVIFRIGSIGDFIAALPVLAAIRRRHPQADITLITNARMIDGKPARPWPEALELDLPLKLWSRTYKDPAELRAELQKAQPQALYYLAPAPASLRRLLRDALFFRAAGVRHASGFTALDPCPLTARLLRPWRIWPDQTRRLITALALGHAPEDEKLFADAPLPAGYSEQRPLVAIASGGKHSTQHWPEERYLEIARRLEDRGYAVGWLGDQDDYDRLRKAGLENGPLVFSGGLSLEQSAGVLRHASLVIANDCGLAHLAALFAAPLLVIQSARDIAGSWAPFRPKGPMKILRTEMNCEGCRLSRCADLRCLTEISVEQVWAAVEKLLASGTARRQAETEAARP